MLVWCIRSCADYGLIERSSEHQCFTLAPREARPEESDRWVTALLREARLAFGDKARIGF